MLVNSAVFMQYTLSEQYRFLSRCLNSNRLDLYQYGGAQALNQLESRCCQVMVKPIFITPIRAHQFFSKGAGDQIFPAQLDLGIVCKTSNFGA